MSFAVAASAAAQEIPAAGDSRHSMLRAAMLGLLTPAVAVSEAAATNAVSNCPLTHPHRSRTLPAGRSEGLSMPFKSQAQRRKFAELRKLPERVTNRKRGKK